MIGLTKTYLSLAFLLCSCLCIAEHTLLPCQESYCSGQNVWLYCNDLDSAYVDWSILDTTDSVVGSASYDSNSAVGDMETITVADVIIWFNKTSDTTYSAWFTANGSLTGYKIVCNDNADDMNTIDSANCSISVNSDLGVPTNLTYDKETLNDTSVVVNWDVPTDNACFQKYFVKIMAGGVNVKNVTVNDPSVLLIEQAQYENENHCVRVAVQGYDRVGQYADLPLCITLDVPEAVEDLKANYQLPQNEDMVDVTITWTQPESTRPEILQYFITHNITHPEEPDDNDNDNDYNSGSGSGSGSGEEPDTTPQQPILEKETIVVNSAQRMLMLDDARKDRTYYIEIVPENCLGNGTATATLFSVVGNVEFSCEAELCLSQRVEYQCTAASYWLRWRISDETMSQLDMLSYFSGGVENVLDIAGAPEFSTVLISNTNPLISNISFTVQSSIEDYTIQCEIPKGGSENHKKCIIKIAAVPSSPLNLTLYYTFTSVVLSWSPPSISSQCVMSYIINSTTSNTDITSTDTSVTLTVPVHHESSTQYCVSVATVDIANRTGQHSESECFILDVPAPIIISYETDHCNSHAIITIKWNSTQSSRPPLTRYFFTYNGTHTGDFTTVILPSSTTSYIFNSLKGNYYLVSVSAENVLGNSTATEEIIYVPEIKEPSIIHTTTYSTVTEVVTTSSSDCITASSTSLILGVASMFILTVVISVIISSLVTLLIAKTYSKSQESKKQPKVAEPLIPMHEVSNH